MRSRHRPPPLGHPPGCRRCCRRGHGSGGVGAWAPSAWGGLTAMAPVHRVRWLRFFAPCVGPGCRRLGRPAAAQLFGIVLQDSLPCLGDRYPTVGAKLNPTQRDTPRRNLAIRRRPLYEVRALASRTGSSADLLASSGDRHETWASPSRRQPRAAPYTGRNQTRGGSPAGRPGSISDPSPGVSLQISQPGLRRHSWKSAGNRPIALGIRYRPGVIGLGWFRSRRLHCIAEIVTGS
jgi:hypothetical protein